MLFCLVAEQFLKSNVIQWMNALLWQMPFKILDVQLQLHAPLNYALVFVGFSSPWAMSMHKLLPVTISAFLSCKHA